jgi:hypothetical protein
MGDRAAEAAHAQFEKGQQHLEWRTLQTCRWMHERNFAWHNYFSFVAPLASG